MNNVQITLVPIKQGVPQIYIVLHYCSWYMKFLASYPKICVKFIIQMIQIFYRRLKIPINSSKLLKKLSFLRKAHYNIKKTTSIKFTMSNYPEDFGMFL